MEALEEILSLWQTVYPGLGYKAGIEQCRGQLFIRSDTAIGQITEWTREIRSNLHTVQDDDLRATGDALLRAIEVDLSLERPDRVPREIASTLFAVMLKDDTAQSFVADLIDRSIEAIQVDQPLWSGHMMTMEEKWHAMRALDFLSKTLDAVATNPGVEGKVAELRSAAAGYMNLFYEANLSELGGEQLLTLLASQTAPPSALAEHALLLQEFYGFQETAEEMRLSATRWLEHELEEVGRLVAELSPRYGVPAHLEDVCTSVGEANAIPTGFLEFATTVTDALNAFTAEKWLDLAADDYVELKETPDYLQPLITEGEVQSFDQLTLRPRSVCFMTPSKNDNLLTLLNVLVHEYAHGFHDLLTFRTAKHALLKIETPLRTADTEAIAFHREWELFEDASAALRRGPTSDAEAGLLRLFGATEAEQQLRMDEFEFETRIWRVARYLRVLCDVAVHTGALTYSQFVERAHEQSGLGRQRVHDYCFTFLKDPGYTPCYAVAGMRLAAIQESAESHGFTRKAFDTLASSVGFYPLTVFERCLRREFNPV